MKKAFIFALLSLLCVSVYAQNDEESISDFQKRLYLEHPEYTGAQRGDAIRKELKRRRTVKFNKDLAAAKRGDIQAMVSVGGYYNYYNEEHKDNQKAFYWYKKAADKGSVDAMEALCESFEKGTFTEKDSSKAVEYLKMIASRNHKKSWKACEKLAIAYHNGIYGQQRDWVEALKWYERRLELKPDDANAMYNMGNIYRTGGHNVKQNNTEAVVWYKKSANTDTSLAAPAYKLGEIYRYRYKEIGENDRNYNVVAYWYKRAANTGKKTKERTWAQYALMDYYYLFYPITTILWNFLVQRFDY